MADNQRAGIVYARDFALVNLTLLTSVSTFELKPALDELSYHENMFSSVISGYVMITDSMGFIETLNLTGNEFLRLTFGKTDQTETWTDKIVRVYKVAKRLPESSGQTESYSLYFCSEEMILSEQYKISKSYKNLPISEIVLDMLENELDCKEKIQELQQTYGSYDFIIPYLKPFDAINWLCTYARPNDAYPGADMVFFENKYGFNFVSMQSLMEQNSYLDYSYTPKNLNTQDINAEVYNVSTYEILESYDALKAIHTGMFANQLISVDPLLRRYKVTDFNYAGYVNESTKLNKYPITNNFKNRFGDGMTSTPQSVMKLVFSNYDQYQAAKIAANPGAVAHDIYAETYIPYRTAQMSLNNYTRMKISVPGDSNMAVGRTINFNLLSKNPNQKHNDAFYSGKYLVTSVRHMFTQNEFKTLMEIAKESTTTQYAGVDNDSLIWKNTVAGKLN
jgi:hypothetical protein